MMRLFICPECGWMRTVSRRASVECFKCNGVMMQPVKLEYTQYVKDVGTGTNGLCRQLDVYPSEKEQIENRSHAEKSVWGFFELQFTYYMYLGKLSCLQEYP